MNEPRTRTDTDSDSRLQDDVIGLRVLGGHDYYELPDNGFAERIVGAAPECDVKIEDAAGWASRKHARLVRSGALWSIHDLSSKNGTWIDGARRPSSTLTPGTEIGIGGVTLVAESHALSELRELLSRWIGWGADRRAEIDRAVHAAREAALGRTALILHGEPDLVGIAARLHHELLGDERPFIVHEGGRGLARAIANAGSGTICFSNGHTHNDLGDAVRALRTPGSRVHVIACANGDVSPLVLQLDRISMIELPPVTSRRRDFARIIEEYAEEYVVRWEQPASLLEDFDLPTLSAQSYDSWAAIEETARRLVALRVFGVTEGASRIGISHGALSRWSKRVGLRRR
ncbi:MAG TPA: FHA domain-containing protein [Kofleriaceae bacterium]|jgi:hypothetical protein